MVLINDKKYACDKCIKGHRVSGCTHTDRPLFEVKKKGRPATQCQHCKDKRKLSGSSVHTKCSCGDIKAPATTLQPPPAAAAEDSSSSTRSVTPPVEDTEVETRKGQPGSKATFPNGLKDVHEIAAAANALAGMGDDGVLRVAERNVHALLNPCKCQIGGPCKCCHPRKDQDNDDPLRGSPPLTTLVTSIPDAGTSSCCAPTTSLTPTSASKPAFSHLPALVPYLSPDNMHHPAHTSPHVHKTKLYSPYSMDSSRLNRRETSSGSRSGHVTPKNLRPPPPRLKPITDVGALIGAVVREDGTVADEVLRSVVGLPKLPGIQTFDEMAENGGVKVEPMEMEDVDMPLAFPTSEDVVLGACMCGDDCPCPDCATHNNDTGTQSPSHAHAASSTGCGEGCKSGHHHCGESVSLPSGISSVSQLIATAALHVPRPPDANRYAFLDPLDMRVLPPAANINEEAARSLGYVQLKPLECCNGRCQCPSGQCVCEKECCGCCIRCACAEGDGDASMDDPTAGSMSTLSVPAPASCCSGNTTDQQQPHSSAPSMQTDSVFPATASASSSSTERRDVQPPQALSSSSSSRQSSPRASGPTTPVTGNPLPSALRRATSSSARLASHHPASGPSGRRATVTGHPPAVGTKATSKAAALGQPRPILPKPSSSGGQLAPRKLSAAASRQPSPVGKAGGMGVPVRVASPGLPRRVNSADPKNAAVATTGISHNGNADQAIPLNPAVPVSSIANQTESSRLESQRMTPPAVPSVPPTTAAAPDVGPISNSSSEIEPKIDIHPSVLEFFDSLIAGGNPEQPLTFDELSTFNSEHQGQPLINSSTDTSPNVDSTFNFDRFLAEAITSQSRDHETAAPHHYESQEQSFAASGFDLSFGDAFAGSGQLAQHQTSKPADHLSTSTDWQPGPVDASYAPHSITDDARHSNGDQLIFPGMIPAMPEQFDYSPLWTSKESVALLNQQRTAEHAGRASESDAGSRHDQRSAFSEGAQPSSQYPSHSYDQAPSQSLTIGEPSVRRRVQIPADRPSEPFNPNIIDLSKPLDAAALARIMQALQQQQQQQEQEQALGQPYTLPQHPSSQPSSQSQSQTRLQHSSSQVESIFPPSQAQAQIQYQSAVSVPPGSDPAPGTNTHATHDLDDMFNQFVTLDGMGTASVFQQDPAQSQDGYDLYPDSLLQHPESELASELSSQGRGYVHMRSGQEWNQGGPEPAPYVWDQSMLGHG